MPPPDRIITACKTWSDFISEMSKLGQDERGKAFELLTELLLQIDPVYRSKLKHVWHEKNLPAPVRRKLGLPSPDIGVDLVAEDRSGAYWAIQCKYHDDPSRNVTKNEINSFLDVTTRICKGRLKTLLVVSSADGESVNLRKHAAEVQFCLSDRFQVLDQAFFRQARALLRKQTPKFKKRTPRPHQKRAVRNAVKHFAKNGASRGKLIHPCGTGKSLIGCWIAQALDAKTILVGLPSLYLVRQTLADWTQESLALKKAMDWMVVCSENTIGDSDDPAMRFQEIGVDVTTNVAEVAAFLRKRSTGQKVIFTTYQSGVVTAKASRKAGRIFDVGIFDEAHKTVGQQDSLFSHLLLEKNIRIRKRVFMTATEKRYQGSSDTILSMDDPEVYGDTFDKMTFREALEAPTPILSDYKLVTMVVGRSEIQHLIDENFFVKPDKGKWDDDTEARALAALIALRKAMKRYRANHALTFHNSIARAEAFKKSQERFNEAIEGYGKVDCYHVSSKVSTGERKRELEQFRHSKKAIITNAKCLTEGVDVPTIDAVLFADPKRSTVDIVQAAGRALRRAVGKKMGYIIIPVLVDEDDPDAADKAFQDILMTLRAMAANDDRIIDYFRSISQGKKPKKSDSAFDLVVPDSLKIRLADFIETIETQSWHRLAKLSWRPFEDARRFVRNLGLANLREWNLYRKGSMSVKGIRPSDIPANPERIYKQVGWQGYGDWIGSGQRRYGEIERATWDEAKAFARDLNLGGEAHWRQFCTCEASGQTSRRPESIPRHPEIVYKRQWSGWADFLGTDNIKHGEQDFWSYGLARNFVHKLELKTIEEWQSYSAGRLAQTHGTRPKEIPSSPNRTYRNSGWKDWSDWLGSKKTRKFETKLGYADAREFVHGLGLRDSREWREYSKSGKRPANIPGSPAYYYKGKGWTDWNDWLGTTPRRLARDDSLEFVDARECARKLRVISVKDWRAAVHHGMLPKGVPRRPDLHYKNRGWISWPDWLGIDK